MKALLEQRLFTLWFGFGLPPLLVGAVAIACAQSWLLGLAASGVFLAWFYETGRTTCARCAYHGTAKCGLPGLVAALLTERKSADSLSPERIRSHLQLDLWILVFVNGLYALQPWLLPVALVWSIGAWCIALGPKRHHGLLHRLRQPQRRDSAARTAISIAQIGRAPRRQPAALERDRARHRVMENP